MASSSAAIKRLSAEYAAIRKGDRHSRDLYAAPLEDNIFEWHFTIMGPQKDKCPYAKGIYHGCLKFPITYPFEPPDVLFFTPNGRFETNVKVCTSVSSFHKNGWRPSFDVVFILSSLRLFMENHDDIGVGGIYKSSMSDEARAKMAEESWNFVCAQCNNNETMKMLYDREMAQHDNSEQDQSEHTNTANDNMASSINQEEETIKEEESRKGIVNVEEEKEQRQQSQPQVCEGNTEPQSPEQLEEVQQINNEEVGKCEINTHTSEHHIGKESAMENNSHSLATSHNNDNVSVVSGGNYISGIDTQQGEHTHDTIHTTNATPEHDDNSSPEMMLRVTILRKVFNIPLKYVDRFVWCNVLYVVIILFKWFIMWWLSTSSTSAK